MKIAVGVLQELESIYIDSRSNKVLNHIGFVRFTDDTTQWFDEMPEIKFIGNKMFLVTTVSKEE